MWRAIYKDDLRIVKEEDGVGRPVQDGQDGKLCVIAEEDFGHSIAVDLVNGVIGIDYDHLGVQNGTIEISAKTMFWICEETNIIANFQHAIASEPDANGDYTIEYKPLQWRPIWFIRHTMPGGPTKVIGAQVTLPESQGNKNVKKLVSIFEDGRIGID